MKVEVNDKIMFNGIWISIVMRFNFLDKNFNKLQKFLFDS